MIRAVGINTKQNNQENVIIFVLGGYKARGIPKGGFGRVLAIKAKKGEKFWSAASTGLTAQLLRKTNLADIFSDSRSGTICHTDHPEFRIMQNSDNT